MRPLGQLNALIWILSETLKALRRGVAVAPLAIYAGVQCLLVLGVVWFAYPPMSSVIAPALRWRLGEEALHYPGNLFALRPALAQADSVLIVVLGAVLAATAVHNFSAFYSGRKESLAAGWRAAIGRYLPLAVLAVVTTVATHLLTRLPFTVFSGLAESSPNAFRLLRAGAVGSAVAVQALFVYTVPNLVLEGRSLISSVRSSFRLAAVSPLTSILIVGVPAALELLPLWLSRLGPTVVHRMAPEFLIGVMFVWIGIIFLGNYLIAGSATRFFLYAARQDEILGGGTAE